MSVTQRGVLSEVLRSGFQRADQGDPSDLLSFGFSLARIRGLLNLPPRKRNRVCDLSLRYLSTALDEARLEEVLVYVDREDPDDPLHDDLLRQGATAPMMRELFGMTKDEFTARRKMLKVSDTGGRPQRVTHSQETAILKSWSKFAGLPYAQRFLLVAKQIKLDLKTIWPVIRPVLEPKAKCRDCQF